MHALTYYLVCRLFIIPDPFRGNKLFDVVVFAKCRVLKEQQQLEDEYVMHTFHRYPAQLVSDEDMMVYDETGQRAWF